MRYLRTLHLPHRFLKRPRARRVIRFPLRAQPRRPRAPRISNMTRYSYNFLSIHSDICKIVAIVLIMIFVGAQPLSAIAASAPPKIISYQGRLTDSSGSLLGGSGTTNYFKFSILDSATVGSGTKLWPATVTSTSANVRQGVFTVNVGDTANGYPTALDLDFSNNTNVYLQVEVSSDNGSFETLSPRQQITSIAYAQVAGAVVGTTTPSYVGTITVTDTASTTDLIVSDGFTFSTITGFLKATAGVVAAALVNLASDVTGILPVANGGTGWNNFASGALLYGNGSSAFSTTTTQASDAGKVLAFLGGVPTWTATTTLDTISGTLAETKGGTNQTTYVTGDILYASAANTLSKLPIGSVGQVLKISGGIPSWGADSTGSGGAGVFATTTDDLAIYPSTVGYVVLVGTSATSTTGNILEVKGNALFRNTLTAYDTISAPSFFATSTSIASTFAGGFVSQASSTVVGLFNSTRASTTQLTNTGSTWFTARPNARLSTDSNGLLASTTTIGAGFISGSWGTINSTAFNRGDSITVTAASSTLLANNNTWTGLNTFANATTTLLS